MLPLPAPPRKATVLPDIRESPQSTAEIFVGPRLVQVTVALPQFADRDLDLTVTPHSIRVRSKTDPRTPTFVIPLPVGVEAGRYVLRHTNGLLDFTLERTSC